MPSNRHDAPNRPPPLVIRFDARHNWAHGNALLHLAPAANDFPLPLPFPLRVPPRGNLNFNHLPHLLGDVPTHGVMRGHLPGPIEHLNRSLPDSDEVSEPQVVDPKSFPLAGGQNLFCSSTASSTENHIWKHRAREQPQQARAFVVFGVGAPAGRS